MRSTGFACGILRRDLNGTLSTSGSNMASRLMLITTEHRQPLQPSLYKSERISYEIIRRVLSSSIIQIPAK